MTDSTTTSRSNNWFVYPKILLAVHYSTFASMVPFMSIFLAAAGLNAIEIGFLLAMMPFLSFLASPLSTIIADKYNCHARVHQVCVVGAVLVWSLMMLLPPKFYLFVIGMSLYSIAEDPLGPLVDVAVLQELGDQKLLYGRQRIFAAVSWGVTSFLVGLAVDEFGIMASLTAYISMSVLYMLVLTVGRRLLSQNNNNSNNNNNNEENKEVVLKLLQETVEDDDDDFESGEKPLKEKTAKVSEFYAKMQVLKNTLNDRYLAFFFLALFFLATGVSCLTSFLFLFLESHFQATKTQLGLTVFVTTISELPFLYYSKEIMGVLGVRGNIIAGIALTAARTFGYSFIPNAWWALAIEPINGISFVLILTSGIDYVSSIAPKNMETTAQGLFNGIWGLGSGVGYIVLGVIYRTHGPIQMFRMYGYLVLVILFLFAGGEVIRSFIGMSKKQGRGVRSDLESGEGEDEEYGEEDRMIQQQQQWMSVTVTKDGGSGEAGN